ncbi:MAG: hypothetical protein AAGF11_43160 [Myxococcota bacterium]
MTMTMTMRMSAVVRVALVGLGLTACGWLAACNQADPMEGSEGATSDPTSDPSGDGLFPLRDGATWTYRHVSTDGTTWDEVVRMRQTTYQGVEAWQIEDNAGLDGENTISTIVRDGDRVMRVHKEVLLGDAPVLSADYEPGFLRVDLGWVEGDSIPWMYDRIEYDEAGTIVDEAVRLQVFTVESVSTSVTVPAGTFDCVQFLRRRPDTGESRRFWFSAGVGKVKHESLATGSTEELAEYAIP